MKKLVRLLSKFQTQQLRKFRMTALTLQLETLLSGGVITAKVVKMFSNST